MKSSRFIPSPHTSRSHRISPSITQPLISHSQQQTSISAALRRTRQQFWIVVSQMESFGLLHDFITGHRPCRYSHSDCLRHSIIPDDRILCSLIKRICFSRLDWSTRHSCGKAEEHNRKPNFNGLDQRSSNYPLQSKRLAAYVRNRQS